MLRALSMVKKSYVITVNDCVIHQMPGGRAGSLQTVDNFCTGASSSTASRLQRAPPYTSLDIDSLLMDHEMYACPICPKVVRKKAHFKRHYMIHTGEKPFECHYCAYRSSRRELVHAHVARIHPEQRANRYAGE